MVQITQNTATLFCVCFFSFLFWRNGNNFKKVKREIHFVLKMAVIQRGSPDLLICFLWFCQENQRIEKHHAGLRSVSIYSRNNHSLHMLNDMGYRVLMYCSSLKLIIKYATTQEKNSSLEREMAETWFRSLFWYILATMGSGVKFVWRVLVKYLDPNLKYTANHQICTKQC